MLKVPRGKTCKGARQLVRTEDVASVTYNFSAPSLEKVYLAGASFVW